MKEIIIGFDARVLPDKEKRFISADTYLWESLPELYCDKLPEKEKAALYKTNFSKIGLNIPFWADLEALKCFLEDKNLKPYCLIAITSFSQEIADKNCWLGIQKTNPAKLSKNWDLLGYDLLIENDESVFACYEKHLIDSSSLNSNGLFADCSKLEQFRSKEKFNHSYILGLWQIPLECGT